MARRSLQALALLAVPLLALALTPAAAHADPAVFPLVDQAGPPPAGAAALAPGDIRIVAVQSDQGWINCQRPSLSTGFGPVAQCSMISGGKARFGLYSPFTNDFGPNTDWLDVLDGRGFRFACTATAESGGAAGTCLGGPIVNTAFGGGYKATQYQATRGRWGWWNVVTTRFYPDGDGAWSPRVND